LLEHGIGCEVLSVPSLKPVRNGDYYILRPEVIESIFYMWRLTKNPKYRKWGFEIAQNIEASCRVPHGGYSGIKSINMTPVVHNNHMESFFLAETLKYLYLMFCDDEVVNLDQWVFNTEAHPLPVINEA
jgi:mannosyl-oligosaccharide alpha-1,2-mannosidase